MTTGTTTVAEWLQAEVEKWPTIQAFAAALKVQDSAVHAWLRRGIVPSAGTEDRLAEVTGVPVADILVMMNTARKAVWAERLARQQRRRGEKAGPSLDARHETTIRKGLQKMMPERLRRTSPTPTPAYAL